MENGDYVVIGKDISSLSSLGILVHCFHLFDSHSKLFWSILILIMIPTLVPETVFLSLKNNDFTSSFERGMNSTAAVGELQLPNGSGAGGADPASSVEDIENLVAAAFAANFQPIRYLIKTGSKWKSQFQVNPTATAVALGVLIFEELLRVGLITIRRSFVTYSVGRIQVGKRTTIVDAWHAFRVLWKRVLWTGICVNAVTLAAVAFMYAPILFFNDELHANDELYVLLCVTMLLSNSIRACSAFTFQLATIVPVLDEAYGWKALGRGWKLLRGKISVAVGIAIFRNVTFLVSLLFQFVFMIVSWLGFCLLRRKLLKPHLDTREFDLISGFSTGVESSLRDMLNETIYAVFCISCLAFHQQSISKSSFFQKLTKAGRDHDC